MKPFKIYENFRKMTRKNASNIYEVNIANILHHVGYVIHLCIVFALIIGEPGVRSDTKTRGGCRKTPHLYELCKLLLISTKKHCQFEKEPLLLKYNLSH